MILVIMAICLIVLLIYVIMVDSRVKKNEKGISVLRNELKKIPVYDFKQLEMATEDMGKCRTDYEISKMEWTKLATILKEKEFNISVLIRDIKRLEKEVYPNGIRPIKFVNANDWRQQ